jgi:hypothetical protein
MGGDWERTGKNMTIEDIVMMPKGVVVGREIVSASFDDWITYVFDHPRAPQHWRWSDDFVEWSVPATNTVNFLAKTFEESGTLLTRFTDHQVAEGLWYFSSMSLSEIPQILWNNEVALTERQRVIRAVQKLYQNCFALRCVPFLSHLEKESNRCSNPLNGACYMWWEDFGMHWPEDVAHNQIEKECLAVLEYTLGLESIACQESALHGLGHSASRYPEFVKSAIDCFIKFNPNADPRLIQYALAAREGNVL